MLILLEKQAETQLPGGQFWEPTERLKAIAANVQETNNVSEADMGPSTF